ncbi:MAG: saccharopine dehydrogenase NADP-binding domain-containing protein [Synergistaceae bacterium]|jgi:saccharopine dehydrogenase-like NADP-dependent oxidoreductase|nr:saccharopine dehydrogenase NADP-binding domain-containing protein [Synergistaceae bacterium]
MKTVLVMGAGRVSAPCIDYLTRHGDCRVAVSDISDVNLAGVASRFPSAVVEREDVRGEAVARLLDKYAPNVVICLLPPELMPVVAKACLEKKVHMIQPSYLDAAFASLSPKVESSGLIFLTEFGLDPGIDHMAAARDIAAIHGQGGLVESFRSLCGALPAPEANDNPWGYKLTWAPSSLIGASKRSAKILAGGNEISWPDGETYEHVYMMNVPGVAVMEVYANADSTIYKEDYGIPEASSIYRGTLRYPGWCETICYMNALGFFETEKRDTRGLSFARFSARQAGSDGDPKDAVCKKFGLKPWSAFILKMEWMGFFDDRPIALNEASPREIVSSLFAERLAMSPEERDLIVLYGEITAKYPDGARRLHKSVLIDYGIPGKWTSIARTTGIPPAIAARFIMEGKIKTPGIHKPTSREIYEPVLRELASEGIELVESHTDI